MFIFVKTNQMKILLSPAKSIHQDKTYEKLFSTEIVFKSETNLYSQFDEDGIPTHDANGEKSSKSMYKKLKKDWEKQKLLYEKNKK